VSLFVRLAFRVIDGCLQSGQETTASLALLKRFSSVCLILIESIVITGKFGAILEVNSISVSRIEDAKDRASVFKKTSALISDRVSRSPLL